MSRRLVVAGVVVDQGRVLAARRTYPEDLAGSWEFPGGKVEPGEDPRLALSRELREELALEVEVGERLEGPREGHWPINDGLDLVVHWCRARRPHPTPMDDSHDMVAWLSADWLTMPQWLPADVAVAERVAELLAADHQAARGRVSG